MYNLTDNFGQNIFFLHKVFFWFEVNLWQGGGLFCIYLNFGVKQCCIPVVSGWTKLSETLLPKASLLDSCFVFVLGQAFQYYHNTIILFLYQLYSVPVSSSGRGQTDWLGLFRHSYSLYGQFWETSTVIYLHFLSHSLYLTFSHVVASASVGGHC